MKVSWLFLIICPFLLQSQVDFTASRSGFNGHSIYSAIPVAIGDVNGDFKDDVVALDRSTNLKAFYQTLNSSRFRVEDYGKVSISDQLSINLGDMDNDGIKEIFIGGYYDGIKVYKSFNNTYTYLQYLKTKTDFYTQNINLIDIDSDGFSDLFICDDDDAPKIYKNDGGLGLEEINLIDFGSEGESASGNYASVWIDFDEDGDLDLYISKCRLGVEDPSDLRRINQLWINENGNFYEDAASHNLAKGEQTWITDFVDLDNDLDLDIVMINHTGSNLIFEQMENGEFIVREQSVFWNEPFEGLQLAVRDFDNDGLKDILIGGFESKLFWNRGDFDFELDTSFIAGRKATSFAVGDLNDDGFSDIYISYAEGISQHNRYLADEILYNNKNENSYLRISLVGADSGRDAFGSKVILYTNQGPQLQVLKSGSGYGISHSSELVFGLPEGTTLDSLEIQWTAGKTQTFHHLVPGTHLVISEHHGIINLPDLSFSEQDVNCFKDSVSISTSNNYATYEWSNGSREKGTFFKQEGYAEVLVKDSFGLQFRSGMLELLRPELKWKPVIDLKNPQNIYCKDQEVILASNYESVEWMDGHMGPIDTTSVREKLYVDHLVCDTRIPSDTFYVSILDVDQPTFDLDTILSGDSAVFTVLGQDIQWYADSATSEIIGTGNTFRVDGLEKDSILYADQGNRALGFDSLNFTVSPAETGFPPEQINGGIIFSISNYQTTLKSIVCRTDIAGVRKFQVKDYWGNIIFEREAFISDNDSIVTLDFILNPSPYYLLTTDAKTNLENLGTKSPRLERSIFNQSIYPLISVNSNVSLLNSTGGQDVFYSFYNWIFEDYNLYCRSDRVGVPVRVQSTSSVKSSLEQDSGDLFPNPAQDQVFLKGKGLYQIRSAQGNLVASGQCVGNEDVVCVIDIAVLLKGIYFISLGERTFKLVKI